LPLESNCLGGRVLSTTRSLAALDTPSNARISVSGVLDTLLIAT
jgi:hypothetical protein